MKVITLCGSTRFKCAFIENAKRLTLDGNVVLIPCIYAHSGDEINQEQKDMLYKIHLYKIDICDEIFVINVGRYIGESTKAEIEYAKAKHKQIRFLEGEA